MGYSLRLKSADYVKKHIYSRQFFKRRDNKLVFFFFYISIEKIYKYNELRLKFLSQFANLLHLPSAFKFFKNDWIQGPRIFVLIIQSLNFNILKIYDTYNFFSFFFNLTWYDFNLIKKILKYKTLVNFCLKLEFIKTECFIELLKIK
jgi:hypothetical protein